MALSHGLAQAGSPADKLDVKAECTFDQVEGGWKITTHGARRHEAPCRAWTRLRSRRPAQSAKDSYLNREHSRATSKWARLNARLA